MHYKGMERTTELPLTLDEVARGSPVFDAQWNVVAIHHKGGNIEVPGKKQTVFRNQGIAIYRVVAGLSGLGFKF